MTMHKILHHRDDVDRLYVPKKEGRRGLAASKTALTHGRLHRKTRTRTNYSHQKRYGRHDRR